MTNSTRNVVILGSTGSIGHSTLEVIQACGDQFLVTALTGNTTFERLVDQARQHRPRFVVAACGDHAQQFDWSRLPRESQLLTGAENLEYVAAHEDVDIVVAAIVGSAGLRSAWAAIESGKTVALANKETLVVAGPLVMELAARRNATILPVDSEHSAIFQALRTGARHEVRRILLTASGGPFRHHSANQLAHVTVDEALAHPTWDMGPKITVDSATMMNKALEIIEARWLFDLDPDQIEVIVHPQSIVHSLVEFNDGAVVAQLSPPDMKLPIQYALAYPQRLDGPAERLDWSETVRLDFEPPDFDRFPALPLGHEVARAGGTAGAVLNAANEAAVEGFLQGQLSFTEIVPACRAVLEHHNHDPNPTLDDLFRLDRWARQEITKWVCT